MERASLNAGQDDELGTPPDDFADDGLIEMANLDRQDTNVRGTIFVSTALGAQGPQVKWYPGRAGRDLPCLIVSIEADPQVRENFPPPAVAKGAVPRVVAWVRLNQTALLDFWANGTSWIRRELSAFLDGLRKLP